MMLELISVLVVSCLQLVLLYCDFAMLEVLILCRFIYFWGDLPAPLHPSGEELACHCRRHRFNLWVRKISWRRKWKPSPVFLPGKSHGRRSLAGYSPWDCRRVGYYLVNKQQHLLLKYRERSLWVFACLWSLFSISHSVFFLPHEGQSIWM